MTRILQQVWQYLGTVEYDTPKGACPLCGYVAITTRIHFCHIAQAVVKWEEVTDGKAS